MTDIRKYTKEWFALNNGSNQQQRNAIKNISSDELDNLRKKDKLAKQTFNYDTLLGTKEEVQAKFENLQKSDKDKKECDLIQSFGGIDNVFDILDADGDGKVSSDEIAAAAAIDTVDWALRDNMTLSANDLSMIYNELNRSERANVVVDGNTTTIKFRAGHESVIEKDEQGNLKSEHKKIKLVDKEVKVIDINYEDKVTNEVIYDSKGRVRSALTDRPGTLNDKNVTIKYSENGRSEKIDTVGRTVNVEFDSDGNVKKQTQTIKYTSDGVIGKTEQNSIGNCWLLSQITALKDTPEGAKALKEAIKQNQDGSVTVTLKGVNKSYTFTPEQVCSGDYGDLTKTYSSGDIDMKIFELAFAEWRKEQITEDAEKFKKDYSQNASLTDPLRSGGKEEVAHVLLGVEATYSSKKDKMTTFIEQKEKNNDRYALVIGFKQEDSSYGMSESGKTPLITTNHQYSIKKVTADTVYVINPWDSSKEIAYPKDKFMENVKNMASVDLDKCKKPETVKP